MLDEIYLKTFEHDTLRIFLQDHVRNDKYKTIGIWRLR